MCLAGRTECVPADHRTAAARARKDKHRRDAAADNLAHLFRRHGVAQVAASSSYEYVAEGSTADLLPLIARPHGRAARGHGWA